MLILKRPKSNKHFDAYLKDFSFKVKKEWRFPFWNIFLCYVLHYANEVSDDFIVGSTLKQYNTQSNISLEILKQCSSNLTPAMYIATERK